VDFRVVDDNGHYAVTDLGVAGLWLAIEERDQFTNYLENNNGNFGGLIVHLKVLTERLRTDSRAPRAATESGAR
jgi:ABC-type transporter MlaC component